MGTESYIEDLLEEVMGKEVEYLTFPSHFDVAIKIKQALSDYSKTIEYIAEAIKRDPLISLKVLQEASRRNRPPIKVLSLPRAIAILGFEHLKRIVLTVVSKQLDQSKATVRHAALSRLIWLNSLYTASAAHVLSNDLTSFDPEEAFMCGLMLNIGAFYLLHQACVTPALRNDFESTVEGIDQYYLFRTIDILTIFEMSSTCIRAVSIHEGEEGWPGELKTLTDVIKTANLLSSSKYPWVTTEKIENIDERYLEKLPEIEEMFQMLKNNKF